MRERLCPRCKPDFIPRDGVIYSLCGSCDARRNEEARPRYTVVISFLRGMGDFRSTATYSDGESDGIVESLRDAFKKAGIRLSALRELQQIDPLDLAGRMSDQYGLCGGECDPGYLTRDEWPEHYLDNEHIGGVIGCTKCRQVLMTTMGPRK